MRLPQPATLTHLCIISTALHDLYICMLSVGSVACCLPPTCGCGHRVHNEVMSHGYPDGVTSPASAMAALCSRLANRGAQVKL